MSLPNIPNMTPTISLSTGQIVPLLLASIALEEIALAHMINSEAEGIQSFLGTLKGGIAVSPTFITLSNFLDLNSSVENNFRDNIMKEMLLEFKFRNVLNLIATTPVPPPTVTVTLSSVADLLCTSGTGLGTTLLTGQVLVNGSPPPAGTPVSFTLSNPAIAIVTTNPTQTDPSGSFSATFEVNTTVPNTEMITATALGQDSNTITIDIVDCATNVTVTLSSVADLLCTSGTGLGTTLLTGQVLVNGSPPPAGTPVSFTLSNPAIAIVTTNPTQTDPSGSFSATFEVNTTVPNTEMITATALGQDSNTITIDIVDCAG